MAAITAPRPFTRSGLHRLDCPCGAYVYARVAQLEAHGMPLCPTCLVPFDPERLELALLLGVDDAPIVAEYRERTARKERAQMPAAKRPCASRESMNDMGAKAAAEIVAEQRLQSRQRRIAAILPVPEALPF